MKAPKVHVVDGRIEVTTQLSASASVRTFLSRQLFKPGAEHFATEARKIKIAKDDEERLRSRMLSFGAVVCSVAYLEAHINSVYIQADEGADIGITDAARKRLSGLWCRSDSGRLKFRGAARVPDALRRYRKAAFAVTRRPQADLGGYFASARDLVFLRNALMHYRARCSIDLPQDEAAFFLRLRGAFPPNPFYPEPQNDFWPKGVLGAGCAQWAVDTSCSLTGWFDGLLK